MQVRAQRKGRFRAQLSHCWRGLLLVLATLSVARAELPVGWEVEVFSGAIYDMVADGSIVVCATGGGLLLYDTQTDTFAQIADAGCVDGNCLRSNQLTALDRDARGQYWVGSLQSGLTVVRPPLGSGEYGYFFADNLSFGGGLQADSVIAVDVWMQESVYVATTRGVSQIDVAGALENFNRQASRSSGVDGFPTAPINDLLADSTFVWVATDAGMFRYQRDPPYSVFPMTTGFVGTVAHAVKRLNGRIHCGTDVGLLIWNESGSTWERLASASPQDFAVLDFAALSGNPVRYVAGSRTDFWFYNGFAWGKLSPPSLPLLQGRLFETVLAIGDSVFACQVNDTDEGGFLEILDARPGVIQWSRRQKSSIPTSSINRIGVSPVNADVWVGTQFAGVARRNSSGEWCVFNGNDANVAANMTDAAGRVEAMLVDRSGDAWFTPLAISARTPVDRLHGDRQCDHTQDAWAHIPPDSLGFGGRYWEIQEDGTGNRYFLSDGDVPSPGGIDVVSADLLQSTNIRADLLGGDAIGALAFDRIDATWQFAYVGVNSRGRQGLLRWTNSNDIFNPGPANFNVRNLPKDVNEYRDIIVDRRAGREHLWVATNEELFQYDLLRQDTLRTIGLKLSAKPGLLSPDIRDLELDDFGSLWSATTKGVNRINLDELASSGILALDAFSTRETVTEINDSNPAVGRLYDPVVTIKPLPSSSVISLAFDSQRRELLIGTALGMAILDVTRVGVRPTTPVDGAFAFPNPLRVFQGNEVMYIGGISEEASVRIYNLEGELVFERTNVVPVALGETPAFKNEAWDLKTQGSTAEGYFAAASGVYLVRIETTQGSKVTSIAVIR